METYLLDKNYIRANDDIEHYCEMLSCYSGDTERTTNDGEWTESELRDNVYDDVKQLFKSNNIEEKYKHRAVRSRELLLCQGMTDYILDNIDVIEVYNRERDKHINDAEQLFAIHHFDDFIIKEVNKTLKKNEVTLNGK